MLDSQTLKSQRRQNPVHDRDALLLQDLQTVVHWKCVRNWWSYHGTCHCHIMSAWDVSNINNIHVKQNGPSCNMKVPRLWLLYRCCRIHIIRFSTRMFDTRTKYFSSCDPMLMQWYGFCLLTGKSREDCRSAFVVQPWFLLQTCHMLRALVLDLYCRTRSNTDFPLNKHLCECELCGCVLCVRVDGGANTCLLLELCLVCSPVFNFTWQGFQDSLSTLFIVDVFKLTDRDEASHTNALFQHAPTIISSTDHRLLHVRSICSCQCLRPHG